MGAGPALPAVERKVVVVSKASIKRNAAILQQMTDTLDKKPSPGLELPELPEKSLERDLLLKMEMRVPASLVPLLLAECKVLRITREEYLRRIAAIWLQIVEKTKNGGWV